MSIGSRLREAREEKNITLDELQEETKIQKRYLTAIENDQFDVLPGKFYAKAFIREYATAVDLDGNQLLTEYGFDENALPEEEETEVRSYSRVQRSAKKASTSNFSIVPKIIVVLLIIGIIVVAWTLLQKSSSDKGGEVIDSPDEELIRDSKESPPADEEDDEEDESETDAEEEPEEEEDDDVDVFIVDDGQSGQDPIIGVNMSGDERVLRLEVSEEVYIDVKSESGEVYYGQILDVDESPKEINLEEDKIYLNIGNTTALKMYINDVEIEYPNDKVHQKLWLDFNASPTEDDEE